jgi:acyl-CoA hydrolase
MVGLTPVFASAPTRRPADDQPAPADPVTIPRVDPKPVAESRALLAHLMGPIDANTTGNIHGGTIMKLTDEVAALAAIKHARTRVVTVGMDRMDFLVPIYVGALVSFTACVNAAWTSSMEVGVRVEAENVLNGTIEHTNTAYLTFVALGADGRPTAVPPAQAQSPDEVRRMREAQLRRTNRLREREEIRAHQRHASSPADDL